jgi:hypothetical protein
VNAATEQTMVERLRGAADYLEQLIEEKRGQVASQLEAEAEWRVTDLRQAADDL